MTRVPMSVNSGLSHHQDKFTGNVCKVYSQVYVLLPPCYSEIISLLGISYGNRCRGRDRVRSMFWGSNVDPGTYSVKSSSHMFYHICSHIVVIMCNHHGFRS